MNIAFLDRDGTIVRDYPDADWAHVRAPEWIPHAFEAMRLIRAKGYKIILVTNQYLIGEGIISAEDYHAFTSLLTARLEEEGVKVLDIFHCPHARTAGCNCCKPAPGLIEQALGKYPNIQLQQSFLVGDSRADEGLAAHFGLPFYRVDEGESAPGSMTLLKAAQRCPSLR